MAQQNNNATQKFVDIRDIKDGIVILKNGQMCSLLLASSINFALKSTDEQKAILQQYQAFLNTLDFSLQTYVQSRKLNIAPYLELLAGRDAQQDNDLMRMQLREYIDFIKSFTEEVDVMSKSFFIVVPYNPSSANIQSGFKSLFKKSAGSSLNDTQFEEYRTQLEQRVSVVEQGLNSLGVRTIPLKNDELVELYYHIFNPSEVTSKAPTRN